MKKILALIFLIGIFFVTSPAFAITYVEDFEAPFPAWESAWLGANTNLQNYYVVAGNPDHSYRGNNPDGLWIDDGDGVYGGDTVEIIFNNAFGSSLTSLALDIAGYQPAHLRIYDMSINLLLDEQVTLTNGATTDPGVYAHYSVTSANGISKFVLTQDGGSQIEGNTGIDNVVVDSGSTPAEVPEPATMLLLGSGLVGLAGFARRKFKK